MNRKTNLTLPYLTLLQARAKPQLVPLLTAPGLE